MKRLANRLKTILNSPAHDGGRIRLQVLFFSLLCISAVILGWRQYLWLNQAGDTQLKTAQREMAIRVVEAQESIRTALESLTLQRLDSGLSGALAEDSTIRRVEVVSFENGVVVDNGDGALYQQVKASLTDRSPLPRGRLISIGTEREPLDVIALLELTGTSRLAYRLYLFELDREQLLQDYLLPSFQTALSDYQFKLQWHNQTLASSAGDTEAQADLNWPLDELAFRPLWQTENQFEFILSRSRDNSSDADDSDNRRHDVFGQIETILRAFNPDNPMAADHSALILKVYANGGSLEQLIRQQIWINAGFGWAVLLLLLITAILLILNSRRIQAQQRREQEFVATVSHELRTPLTVIRSAADNLQSGKVTHPDSIVRYGDEITRQSLRLDRMIESTLYYSRLPSQTSIRMDSQAAEDLFHDILTPLKKVAEDRKVTLHLSQQYHCEQMTTDLTGLRMIVENLIMNALIHGIPDQPPAQIWLRIELTEQRLMLEVADNGPGIAKNEQSRIFEPFARGRASEQQHRPGTGLGLNLVQRTTDRLGGHLTMNSPYQTPLGTRQQGVQFIIELPNHRPIQETSSS